MYQIGLGPVLNPVEHQLIDAGLFFLYNYPFWQISRYMRGGISFPQIFIKIYMQQLLFNWY